jgi:NADPH-dependent glutamate synthase beta subunit-like oxidoreductase
MPQAGRNGCWNSGNVYPARNNFRLSSGVVKSKTRLCFAGSICSDVCTKHKMEKVEVVDKYLVTTI